MELYERLKKQVIGLTHSQFAVPLLDQLFDRPVFQSTHLKFEGGVTAGRLRGLMIGGGDFPGNREPERAFQQRHDCWPCESTG